MSLVDDAQLSEEVGARLREIRHAKGWSLEDVQQRTGWSASAVGAWERGFRALSVPRLRQVADFYDVPVAVILGRDDAPGTGDERRLVFDLEVLSRISDFAVGGAIAGGSGPAALERLRRFVRSIITQRGDYNGRRLTLRHSDLQAVTVLMGADTPALAIEELDDWGVLA